MKEYKNIVMVVGDGKALYAKWNEIYMKPDTRPMEILEPTPDWVQALLNSDEEIDPEKDPFMAARVEAAGDWHTKNWNGICVCGPAKILAHTFNALVFEFYTYGGHAIPFFQKLEKENSGLHYTFATEGREIVA